ncbi:ADP-ribosylglycohydrolase family protein [Spirosoma sp. 209]|uniref:ADP-ribosylglycohydrolase family protein n=1 Tax=Spirosoma sp. 209 TaxID=1955701 RepID=UPI00098D69B1|nr:ADP-ribosylglycohydrolase family protein [Spirosoma sp. 209]
MKNRVKGALMGAAVADALGVPVEFKSREYLTQQPVTDYTGYGTWNQPPGTFSDDSSMLLCTAESLCRGLDLNDIASLFSRWLQQGHWSARGQVFDIGNATHMAIQQLMLGVSPLDSGGRSEHSNGNGSLMRILPLAISLRTEPDRAARYETVRQVSGITHAHVRSVLACFIYVEFAIALLNGESKQAAYAQTQQQITSFLDGQPIDSHEISLFDRTLKADLTALDVSRIRSSGYVIDTLESSLWCFLHSSTYSESVLTAVNLGEDTDTTACVTGGLAGIYYGYEAIPAHWINGLARHTDIIDLADLLAARYP